MDDINHNLPTQSQLLLYQTEDGQTRIEVRLQDETVWLTINQMAELFQVDKSGISRHLKNIYDTHELTREATVAKFATVQQEAMDKVHSEYEKIRLKQMNELSPVEKHFLKSMKEMKKIEASVKRSKKS
ncbi:hypothetical protein JW835_08605 [bacterium]|nr:hypothetical protein [bacterium]